MPRIFDNLTGETRLLPALGEALAAGERADFCVGYFNLRGWKTLAPHVAHFAGPGESEDSQDGGACRVLVGMHRPPRELADALAHGAAKEERVTNRVIDRERRRLAAEFRRQLTVGVPTDEDERALRDLAASLKAGRVRVKLFLKHTLHAKLYLAHRDDAGNPITAFLGSSNLTLSGLEAQGELNVDVVDHDAAAKLAKWFEDRWADEKCVDITDDLVAVIEEGWPGEHAPYEVYLKIAYHLAGDARAGEEQFEITPELAGVLLPHQEKAVQLAARHLTRRGGVMLGDVVGLGKTLMATALASIVERDFGFSTLVLCPKNLVPMWEDHVARYGLRGKVIPTSMAAKRLPDVPGRFRLVLIDESHAFRNREGVAYKAIREFVVQTDARVVLLSATPYNKRYEDLGAQLRLFLDDGEDVGCRPERLLAELGSVEFRARYDCPERSVAAFEKSDRPDDWRDLMRHFLVRRTRAFVREHYAKVDDSDGPDAGRQYLEIPGRGRFYFPDRVPKTVPFKTDARSDRYAKLYTKAVVDAVNGLALPRYGLGNYLVDPAPNGLLGNGAARGEKAVVADLTTAGRRLMGFCRTNLFKRLESSGPAFLMSVSRHILRNHVTLHALKSGLPVPVGTQEAALLDPTDSDADLWAADTPEAEGDDDQFERRAAEVYDHLRNRHKTRFKWLSPDWFRPQLVADLLADADVLKTVLDRGRPWVPERDDKLNALHILLAETHGDEKALVFTQFADTVEYLTEQLKARGVEEIAAVTGGTADPTALARRFSPEAAGGLKGEEAPLRVLVATDLLSEGQNLQDCRVVVNFDLPWAIIRLIQRAGRVDRIGQTAREIVCYSFLPADGIETVIRLRGRVTARLKENREVVGTDERFFEDADPDRGEQAWRDLFTEKSGVLDEPAGDAGEVDLASRAQEIWNRATEHDPALAGRVKALPDVVLATKPHQAGPKPPGADGPEGVLTYLRTPDGHDALSWVEPDGTVVSDAAGRVLDAAACGPNTPALPHRPEHHALVENAVKRLAEDRPADAGTLGGRRNVKFRVYERLKAYLDENAGGLFATAELRAAVEALFRRPLREAARGTLNRVLRDGIADDDLAELVLRLHDDGRLCVAGTEGENKTGRPQIVCSLGLAAAAAQHPGK